MDLTHQDVRDILEIIDRAEHLNEIELVMGGFRLHVVRQGTGTAMAQQSMPIPAPRVDVTSVPMPSSEPAATSSPPARSHPGGRNDDVVAEDIVAIRAPMLGTFYRAPAPNERPFVEVGQSVKADDTVCMIEVMKLFNSISAGVDGTIAKICADNEAMVEFNQVLIHVKPGK